MWVYWCFIYFLITLHGLCILSLKRVKSDFDCSHYLIWNFNYHVPWICDSHFSNIRISVARIYFVMQRYIHSHLYAHYFGSYIVYLLLLLGLTSSWLWHKYSMHYFNYLAIFRAILSQQSLAMFKLDSTQFKQTWAKPILSFICQTRAQLVAALVIFTTVVIKCLNCHNI